MLVNLEIWSHSLYVSMVCLLQKTQHTMRPLAIRWNLSSHHLTKQQEQYLSRWMLRAACISHKFWNEYVLMNLANMYSLGNAVVAILFLSDFWMSADYWWAWKLPASVPKQCLSRQNKLTKDNCVPKVTTYSFCLFEFSLEMSGTKTFFYVKKVFVFPLTYSIENFDYVLSSF